MTAWSMSYRATTESCQGNTSGTSVYEKHWIRRLDFQR